jgi:type 1 fimbriae regulatory protein FimE
MPKVLDFPALPGALSSNVLRKVPVRRTNAALRSREYLTSEEVEALLKAAAKIGRHSHRDRTLLLLTYRHGLRVSEAISLRWDQIDFKAGRLHVNRLKNGMPATHYLEGDELRALRRVQTARPESPFVFTTERGGPLTRSTVNKLVSRAGLLAGLSFPVHPHMLRHACGFYLANKGVDTRTIQDYLGHRSIQHTVKYTQLTPHRFKGLWT